MNGIIVIDKPQGMTSHDVVSVLRRKTGVKRVGHTGTLDPMATGVLPVFIGNATRVIEYISEAGDPEAKLYSCSMKLGIETDTQDIWGKVASQSDEWPEISAIERVLSSFEGPGVQKPPMYSSVKIKGRKLYEYARKGTEIDLDQIPDREVYIKHINVEKIDASAKEVYFEVLCSRGVYIRTICADAGRILGCGAVMSSLRRLKSDGFSIDSAVSLDMVESSGTLSLLPADAPLGFLPRLKIDEETARAFAQGKTIETHTDDTAGMIVRVYCNDSFIGIGKRKGSNTVKPEKVFIDSEYKSNGAHIPYRPKSGV